jgi:glycosyltransferase involved in cell wall biosynthesis
MTKRALIVAHKFLASAPRPLKEIAWLQEQSWTIDTVGIGAAPPINGIHHEVRLPSFFTRVLYYLVPNMRIRFEKLYGDYFPKSLSAEFSSYDLIIIHDPTFLPLPQIRTEVLRRAGKGVIIDLHENHVDSLSRNKLEELVFGKYRKWEYAQFKSLVKECAGHITLTTVSEEIALAFQGSVGVMPSILRNAPAYVEQTPTPVNSNDIRLVHHGVGTNFRGIEESIQALRQLPDKFSLTLYLVASQVYIWKLKLLALIYGVRSRVRFMEPVPTRELAAELNNYDLALVLIPPVTVNEDQAVPNKLLESIQARLGLIVGPNSAMSKIVRDNSIGLVLKGWKSADLVSGLNLITADDIAKYKSNSGSVSEEFSANSDREVFLGLIQK